MVESKINKYKGIVYFLILMMSIFAIGIVYVWVFFDPAIDEKYVPSVISGIASSTGLIVGFSATIFGLTCSKIKNSDPNKSTIGDLDDYVKSLGGFKEILSFVLFTMGSILLLCITYMLLGLNIAIFPFKLGISSMLIAFIGFTNVILSIARKVSYHEELAIVSKQVSG